MCFLIWNRRDHLGRIKFSQSVTKPYEIAVSSTDLPSFSKGFYLEFKVTGSIDS